MSSQNPAKRVRTIDDVPGWFHRTDQLVMDRLLRHQAAEHVGGDLMELGVYLGKCAILIGLHRNDGERLVVCDLFGTEAAAAENQRSAAFYRSLTHEAFEANFAAFHAEPATVIVGPTTLVPQHVPAHSCRFIHIDACHLYDQVVEDIEIARSSLIPDGIVAFDDIRTAHTPGVPAAVWPLAARGELRPIAITPNKLYATWGEADPAIDHLHEWIKSTGGKAAPHVIAGRRLLRVDSWKVPPPSPVPPLWPAASRDATRARLRGVAADLLPPILTRAIKRARRRKPG